MKTIPTARELLKQAMAANLTAEQLQASFKDLPLAVCQDLLDRSAIITEDCPLGGKFKIYQSGVSK